VIFQIGDPETTNLRWGIEMLLREQGWFPTRNVVIALERYFLTVAFGDVETAKMFDERIQMSALEANTRFYTPDGGE